MFALGFAVLILIGLPIASLWGFTISATLWLLALVGAEATAPRDSSLQRNA